MSGRKRILALALALGSIGVAVMDQAPAAAASACEDLNGVTHYGEPLADTTPVVLVCGFTGSDSTWRKWIEVTIDDDVQPLDRSFLDQLLRIDAVSVWTFDYHDTSARWVADPTIGPALAELLTCLADNGGQPAVLAVHSMGGLAAKYAMAPMDDTSVVSGMVTFGTPHLGSDIAFWMSSGFDFAELVTAGSPAGLAVGLLRDALDECDAAKTESLDDTDCGAIGALPPIGSEAGVALERASTALISLPAIPDNVSTLAIAGKSNWCYKADSGSSTKT